MEYNFSETEKKWQQHWRENKTFAAKNNSPKPKFYVLDMFPYPSGAGLHVGHPLGYIASDIFARYKRLKGFNVLHPMGYDSFGLPAEQYAIQTGQHPSITTENNISRYREQLDKIGLSFDWDREVRTSDPQYYKWTQWIFIRLFNSWYNLNSDKTENISNLISEFEKNGNGSVNAVCEETKTFSAAEWKALNEKEQQEILLNYRLAFLSETMVNWCPQLGTVLANEEVKDGVSERGGYPVVRKQMQQWSLRITAFAERLLTGLDKIDWPEPIKEAQRNWIGKSEGTSLTFKVKNHDTEIEVFTTRPDTIFGVSFITLAPEHPLVERITEKEYFNTVEHYIIASKNRSERERLADVNTITGEFTGAYAVHPFTGENIPIWIGDYVLAGYGTGAVMAVPGHDSRDYAFAKHFSLPIKEVVSGGNLLEASYDAKEGKLINSDFLNGLEVKEAVKKAIKNIEEKNLGKAKINYRMRDAIFGRQRYWGEPIPVYYKEGIPYVLDEKDLPLVLPEVDKYLPTESGEPPLARAKNWKPSRVIETEKDDNALFEYSTMPGWAGSSWYYLRYEDAGNKKEFVSKEAVDYWQNVDLYIGGQEHATGHLLYVRFWTKFLNDLGLIPFDEPVKKLINQGMIQGRSNFVYRINGKKTFVSKGLIANHEVTPLNVDVNIVENDQLDLDKFKKWRPEFADADFILEEGKYYCGVEVEKMSKSKWNVVSPDDIINQYGADCLRLYEMFLGPLEQSKPWNTNGISGVSNFIRKLWRLYHRSETRNQGGPEGAVQPETHFYVSDEAPGKAELKTLHKTIKKITEDIERFSFNTSVSNFMICVNELTELKCNKREILEPLAIIISPYAPHVAEELWSRLGHTESISLAEFPVAEEKYLIEDSFAYPVSFNGKMRFKMELPLSLQLPEIEKEVMSSEEAKKYLEGKSPKKVIIVHNKIVNIVL
jgi:leucyl-tRNA synthetase